MFFIYTAMNIYKFIHIIDEHKHTHELFVYLRPIFTQQNALMLILSNILMIENP